MTVVAVAELVERKLREAEALLKLAREQIAGKGYAGPKLFLGRSTAQKALYLLSAFVEVYGPTPKGDHALAPSQLDLLQRKIVDANLVIADAQRKLETPNEKKGTP